MRMMFLTAGLLLAAPLSASAAEGLSYTYVEGGWNQTKVDAGDLGNDRFNGGYLRGSFAIAEQVHVFGGWSRSSDTSNLGITRIKTTLDLPHLGIGYHMPLSDRLDFTADLAWARREAKSEYSWGSTRFTDKHHANTAVGNLGIRGKPSERTEGWVKAGYIEGNNHFKGTWTGTVGGQFNITPTWGVVAEGQFYDHVSEYRVGVRASF